MTESRRPDPETPSPQGDEYERMFERIADAVGGQRMQASPLG